jgi:EmrB/QacA subfamily drug resistance transporter
MVPHASDDAVSTEGTGSGGSSVGNPARLGTMEDSETPPARPATAVGVGSPAGADGEIDLSDPDPEEAGPELRMPHFGMAVICFILFLTFLDNTVISATLSDVQSGLHAGVAQLQWVVSGYALAFASLMLMAGTLGDLYGRKKLMLIGVVIFCGGSVLCALADSTGTLTAGRVVMGVGAACSEPGTLSMIRHLYPHRRRRARALGIWAAVSGLALALGPVIGGVLVGLWSWRAVFWFNLIFGALALLAAAIVLPENSDPVRARLDFPGFILGAMAIGFATFATIAGETAGYVVWWILLLYGVAVAAAVLFVVVELRAENPVLNVRFFRKPAFANSTILAFTTYFGIFSIFFFVALYLEVVGSASPFSLALDFIPMTVGMVLASLFTGRWVSAMGPRYPMVVGCVLAAAGIILTEVVISPTSGVSSVGWTLALAGIGFGIVIVPVTSSALTTVPPEHSGMAASATNTSRELGAVAGVAILGSIVNGQLTVNLTHRLAAIGIPASFRSQVIAAITSGSLGSQAKGVAGKSSAAIQAIINKVVTAAYGAFAHGLEFALLASGSLLLASAVLAYFAAAKTPAADVEAE